MSWLSRLFNRNPTTSWSDAGRVIEADIGRGTLLGKTFGARVNEFASLGPADVWPGANGGGVLAYRARGVQADFEFGQFTGYTLTLVDFDGAARFSGRLFRNGTPLPLEAGDRVEAVVQAIGTPTSTDADDEETILKYVTGNLVVEYEIDNSRGLYAIVVIHEGDVDAGSPGW